MSSQPQAGHRRRSGRTSGSSRSPATISRVSIAAVDRVAREGRYLAMLEAPSFVRTRRFVLDSLKAGGRARGGASRATTR